LDLLSPVRPNQDGGAQDAAGDSGWRRAIQDSGVAECDSESRSNAGDCSGAFGKEGAPKKFLVNSSPINARNPANINIATKHSIDASKKRWRIG
jgi:hypothetical protein